MFMELSAQGVRVETKCARQMMTKLPTEMDSNYLENNVVKGSSLGSQFQFFNLSGIETKPRQFGKKRNLLERYGGPLQR